MSIIPSSAPNNTNPTAALTPERIAEIKDLLKYESSIAFYSHRAKESMLLLVAGVECMRAELAAHRSRAEVLAEASSWLDTVGEREAAYLLRTCDVPAKSEATS
jgi:hypothetical protein